MKLKPTVKSIDGKDTISAELRACLYRYCLSLTRSKHDAEDLMQETLLKEMTRRQRYGEHANPEALLLRIAKNSWIDNLRRLALYQDILKQEKNQSEDLIQVEEDKSRERMARAFQVLMRHLSASQRMVLLLREVFGYSAAECALYLGTSEGAVKSLLHRARRALEANRLVEAYDSQSDIDIPWDVDVDEMVEAYVQGDMERLLQLVIITEGEFVEATGSYQTGSSGRSCTSSSFYQPYQKMEMRLAS